MSVNTGVGLLLLGVILYVLGVVIPLSLLVTLGVVLGVVGLAVVVISLLSGRRGRSKDTVF